MWFEVLRVEEHNRQWKGGGMLRRVRMSDVDKQSSKANHVVNFTLKEVDLKAILRILVHF